MKIFPLALIGIFFTGYLLAQHIKTLDNSKICELPKDFGYIKPVDSFKDELKLTIQINEFSDGKNTKKYNIHYTETLTNESSIIQISNTGAIRISIARVIENANKYYLYKIHLYQKVDGCWEDQAASANWSKCSLGKITNGYGYGTKGTSRYIGFSGEIMIE